MTTKMKCRILDVANGMGWSDVTLDVELPEGMTIDDEAEKTAEAVNRASYLYLLDEGEEEDDEIMGGVVQSAGSRDCGICWVESHGGSSCDIIIEWSAR